MIRLGFRAALLSAVSALSTTSPTSAQQLPFESYSINDGLAQSAVVAIAQTPDGSLWFGTQAGLSRFDGLEFTNLGVDDGLPGALVRCLEVGADGSLWVGTEDGVARLDPVTLEIERFPELDQLAVRSIDASASPIIFGTWESGLVELEGSDLRRITAADGLPSDRVRVVRRPRLGASKDTVWIGTWGEGVVVQGPGGFTRPTPPSIDDARRIRAIYEDPRGRVWIGADDGLWRAEAGRLVRVPGAANLDRVAITAIVLDSHQRLWLATRDRGACRLDAELTSLECLGVAQGLADNSVYALHEDHEGSVWLGTYGGGVSRLSTEGFFNFREGAGLAHANVYAFAEDQQGRIWAGTNGGGVSVWDGTRWVTYTTRDGLAHDKVVSLLATSDGRLLLGTLDGLCSTRGDGTFTCLDRDDGLPHEIVLALAHQPSGGESGGAPQDALWIGTHDGLARLDGGVMTTWTPEDGLPDSRINALTTLRDGRVAVGTGAGLVIADATGDQLRLEPRAQGLFVTAIYEDDGGALWITSTEGLLRLAGETTTRWTVADGLPHRLCSFVIGDGTGGIWVGTNRGLAWFEGQHVDATSPDGTAFSVYTARDGLPSSETNRNAAFRDGRGRLWFGTVQGIAVVQRAGNPLPRRPPRTLVTGFASREGRLPLDGSARIPGGRPESLDIEYVGISLSAGSEVSYEISLEGFDSTWKRSRSRSVQYTALPPGRYVFLVRSTIPGSESSAPARLPFEIVPAWWQRSSVRVLAGFAVLGLALAWGASLKRRNLVLEARVRERTEELEKLNSELERLAFHDRLTALPNRHAFSFVIGRELSERRRRLARGETPSRLTVALVDLDRFKPLNDTCGHAFGDRVLVETAAALTSAVRGADVVARWGGEEFLLLLRDASQHEIPAVANRVLEAVRNISLPRPDGSALGLTTSLGWCDFPTGLAIDVGRWEEVLHLADLALYEAKAAGRNCARGWRWNEGAKGVDFDRALAAGVAPPEAVAELVRAE